MPERPRSDRRDHRARSVDLTFDLDTPRPIPVFGRFAVDPRDSSGQTWLFYWDNHIYFAGRDEVEVAQLDNPGVRAAIDSLRHTVDGEPRMRRAESRLPMDHCRHTWTDPASGLSYQTRPEEHSMTEREDDFQGWVTNLYTRFAGVEPEMVDPGEPPVNTAADLNFTFSGTTATMPEDELMRALRERAEQMALNRERRRNGLPEEGQEDTPCWDGLPSSQPLLAARTRRGYGSCIERQAQAECPPSCPCRTSSRQG